MEISLKNEYYSDFSNVIENQKDDVVLTGNLVSNFIEEKENTLQDLKSDSEQLVEKSLLYIYNFLTLSSDKPIATDILFTNGFYDALFAIKNHNLTKYVYEIIKVIVVIEEDASRLFKSGFLSMILRNDDQVNENSIHVVRVLIDCFNKSNLCCCLFASADILHHSLLEKDLSEISVVRYLHLLYMNLFRSSELKTVYPKEGPPFVPEHIVLNFLSNYSGEPLFNIEKAKRFAANGIDCSSVLLSFFISQFSTSFDISYESMNILSSILNEVKYLMCKDAIRRDYVIGAFNVENFTKFVCNSMASFNDVFLAQLSQFLEYLFLDCDINERDSFVYTCLDYSLLVIDQHIRNEELSCCSVRTLNLLIKLEDKGNTPIEVCKIIRESSALPSLFSNMYNASFFNKISILNLYTRVSKPSNLTYDFFTFLIDIMDYSNTFCPDLKDTFKHLGKICKRQVKKQRKITHGEQNTISYYAKQTGFYDKLYDVIERAEDKSTYKVIDHLIDCLTEDESETIVL